MKTISLVLVLSLLFSASLAAIDYSCYPTWTETQQSSWKNGGSDSVFSLWRVDIYAPSSISSLGFSVQDGSFYQVWELVLESGQYVLPQWRQQSGGLPQGSTHTFGYITPQNSSVTLVLTSLVCSSSSAPSTPPPSTPSVPPPSTPSPTSAPVTPAPTSSAPVTSSPVTPSPTAPAEDTIGQPNRFPAGVCSTVVVIDSYIVRNSGTQSVDEIKQKYSAYFADVQRYYKYTFNVDLQFSYYVEEGASFSDSLDGGQVLVDFSTAIENQVFGNPTNQCLYHLLTGRQPYGIGGLAYVGTVCNQFSNVGLTVDGNANEDPELVIRRAIHEIGHNFGGDHPDRYTSAPNDYQCSVGEDRESDRILRSVRAPPSYQYLSQNAFISECAVQSIRDSMSAFQCLFPIYASNPVYPQAILCEDEDAEGCHVVQSYNGDQACYNILAFNDAVSSFQVFPGKNTAPRAVGLQLFADVDCRGTSVDVVSYYSSSLPNFNDQASSFKFIVQ
eukprot:TRINITY_DN451_c0_g1_i2.p1 TRINITY_DN451_c0_g1~~TRINITY_DN451_c0_g1_i2.p1  ORF type:complete len:500 (-),score=152.99 TRINITY_DN451_c0_g1_i2:27-1526(-)